MSGVVGVYAPGENAFPMAYRAMRNLQHRGEAGTGIGFSINNEIPVKHGDGNVASVMNPDANFFNSLHAECIIGHTAYDEHSIGQPRVFERHGYKLAPVVDGYLVGDEPADVQLGQAFIRHLSSGSDVYSAARHIMEEMYGRGCYSAVMHVKKDSALKTIALRDPTGVKPLYVASDDYITAVASESVAMQGIFPECDIYSMPYSRDVAPGEIIALEDLPIETNVLCQGAPAHCIFEHHYFASPGSKIDGISVYVYRKHIGELLAQKAHERGADIDIVCCSPDSGRGVALGFANSAGIPFEEVLVKNPGSMRAYQIGDPRLRAQEAEVKFSMVYGIIEYYGKQLGRPVNIGIGDDSIVRGTNSAVMTSKLRRSPYTGKIYYIISYPGIVGPCFYYFGDANRGNVALAGMYEAGTEAMERVLAEKTGADGVILPEREWIRELMGDKICMACADLAYPVNAEYVPEQFRR